MFIYHFIGEYMLKVRTTTDDSTEAMRIATYLVDSKLAASAHTKLVNSVYTWEGTVHNKQEFEVELLIDDDMLGKVEETITKMHHYVVPEIISVKVEASSDITKWCHDWCHGGIQ